MPQGQGVTKALDLIAGHAIYGIAGLIPLAILPVAGYTLWETPKVAVLNVLTIVALAAWVIRAAWSRDWRITIPPFFLPVMVYFDVYVLATIFSLSPVLSIFGIHDRSMGLINLTNLVLLYFLAFNILATREQQIRCLKVMVISAVLVSAMGVLEYSGANPLPFFPDLKGKRVGATLGNADYATPVIVLALPLAAAFVLKSWRSRFLKDRIKALRYAAGLALLAAMLLFSLPTPGLNWDIPKDDAPEKPSKSDVSVTEAVAALPAVAAGRLEARRGLWEAGIKAALAYPVLGSGPNTYRDVFTRYEPIYYVRMLPNYHEDKVHNEFIEVAQSTGLTGLAAYLWMLGAILWFFWRWLRRNRNDPDGILVGAILVGAGAYTAYTFLVFHTIAAYTWFWLMIGLGGGMCLNSRLAAQTHATRQAGHTEKVEPARGPRGHGRRSLPGLPAVAVTVASVAAAAWLGFTALRPVLADASLARARQVAVRDLESHNEAVNWRRRSAELHPYEYRYLTSAARAVVELGVAAKAAPVDGAEFHEAFSYLDRAIRQEPYKASGYFNRAMVYLRTGKSPDEALKEIDKAIELYPYYVTAYNLAADIEATRKDWDRAVALRRKALDILPEDTEMMVQIGHDSIQGRRPAEAIVVLEKAISTGNKSARSRFLLGGAHELSGHPEKARLAYEAALVIDPGNVRARIALERLIARPRG